MSPSSSACGWCGDGGSSHDDDGEDGDVGENGDLQHRVNMGEAIFNWRTVSYVQEISIWRHHHHHHHHHCFYLFHHCHHSSLPQQQKPPATQKASRNIPVEFDLASLPLLCWCWFYKVLVCTSVSTSLLTLGTYGLIFFLGPGVLFGFWI